MIPSTIVSPIRQKKEKLTKSAMDAARESKKKRPLMTLAQRRKVYTNSQLVPLCFLYPKNVTLTNGTTNIGPTPMRNRVWLSNTAPVITTWAITTEAPNRKGASSLLGFCEKSARSSAFFVDFFIPKPLMS